MLEILIIICLCCSPFFIIFMPILLIPIMPIIIFTYMMFTPFVIMLSCFTIVGIVFGTIKSIGLVVFSIISMPMTFVIIKTMGDNCQQYRTSIFQKYFIPTCENSYFDSLNNDINIFITMVFLVSIVIAYLFKINR